VVEFYLYCLRLFEVRIKVNIIISGGAGSNFDKEKKKRSKTVQNELSACRLLRFHTIAREARRN
jgi:hypothetical protein